MNPIREILNRLEEFESADALAAFFEERQMFGWPNEPAHCPVAIYVNEVAGTLGLLQVVDDGLVAPTVETGKTIGFLQGGVTMEFVKKFDEGHYPQLQEHS